MKRAYILAGFTLAAALIMIPAAGRAETEDYPLIKDTYVDQVNPDLNFGTRATIFIKNTESFSCGSFQIDDPELPEGAVLDGATFNFEIISHSGAFTTTVGLDALAESAWTEEGMTWNSGPNRHGDVAFHSNQTLSTANGWKELDIAHIAESWLDGSLDNNGFSLCGRAGGDPAEFYLESRQGGTPYVQIEYSIGEVAEAEFFAPFVLVSPDAEAINVSRPTFSWTSLEGLDVGELILVVNMVIDDGADVEEVIRDSVPIDETESTTLTELEDGEYRWYMEAYWGGDPVYRTESNEFSIELLAASTVPAAGTDTELTDDMVSGDEEATEGRVISLGTEKVEGVQIDYLVIVLIFVVGSSVLILFGMFAMTTTRQKSMASGHTEGSTIDVEHMQTNEIQTGLSQPTPTPTAPPVQTQAPPANTQPVTPAPTRPAGQPQATPPMSDPTPPQNLDESAIEDPEQIVKTFKVDIE